MRRLNKWDDGQIHQTDIFFRLSIVFLDIMDMLKKAKYAIKSLQIYHIKTMAEEVISYYWLENFSAATICVFKALNSNDPQ